jgi:hypothetical protein
LGTRSLNFDNNNFTYDKPYKINSNWLYMNRSNKRILIRIASDNTMYAYKINNKYDNSVNQNNTCPWIVVYPDDTTKVGLVENNIITAIDINDFTWSTFCYSNESGLINDSVSVWNNADNIFPNLIPVQETKYYTDMNGNITTTNTGLNIGTSLDGYSIKLNWTFTL